MSRVLYMALIVNDTKLQNQATVLQAASLVDGELGKRLREAIYKEMAAARSRIVKDIKFKNGDPRGTAHAVKRYVASKYLGGIVSILNGKEASGSSSYEAPRTLREGQRGGNRRKRSDRTNTILHYLPVDRGFILRFVNSGTYKSNPRTVAFKQNDKRKIDKWNKHPNTGGRGAIAPRNFFGINGQPEVDKALQNLAKIIDEEFEKLFKE